MVIADVSVQETPVRVEPDGAPAGTAKPLEAPLATYVVPAGIPSETTLLIASVFELLIQTIVHCRSGRPESSKVFNPNGGSNRLGAPVALAVGEAVDVGVAVVVEVPVEVGVAVDVFVGVLVAVSVGVTVDVLVGVSVGVFVVVDVGVLVGVSVGVLVAVSVGVLVTVFVGVCEGVGEASKTDNVAVAVLPVPPFVEVTLPVVFTYAPVEEAVTFAVTVQLPLAAMEPPVSVMTSPPDVPVMVPPH